MQCMRRLDIDTGARVTIAVQACLGLGVDGEITRSARFSQVSRVFVDKRRWQLLALYPWAVCDPWSAQAIRQEVERSILLLRLVGHGALAAISHILKPLGRPVSAIGSMAQRLATYARALPNAALSGTQIVFRLCDEICTLGQPILLTVAPRSLAMLKSALVAKREAETWKKHWGALADAGVIEPPTVVADQGAGLVKGWAVMGLMHPPEVGHLLRPLALCGERCSRQARAAIAWEYERGSLEIGRSASVIHKRMESYAAAKAAAEEQSRRSDPFSSLWAELRQARAWFDSEGSIPDGASRQAESEAMVALLREGGGAQLQQALSSFASGLEGEGSYDRRAEDVSQGLPQRYPRAVVEVCACGWPWQRQATTSTDDGMRKRLAQAAAFYDDEAASLLPAHGAAIRQEVEETLDAEVRSASLVEKIHAALRPLLATCRGQVDQDMLAVCAYGHHHRRFVRGKRADKAPIEILTGKELEKTWLASLLETA